MMRFDARLCLTELVTNALEHAGVLEGEQIAIHVRGDDGAWLRLDVTYPGTGFVPGPRTSASGTDKGRGLALVDAVSDSWGAARDEGHVWVELRVARGGSVRKTGSLGAALVRRSA
jgi:serine/threonine-protein kinase RsbW